MDVVDINGFNTLKLDPPNIYSQFVSHCLNIILMYHVSHKQVCGLVSFMSI